MDFDTGALHGASRLVHHRSRDRRGGFRVGPGNGSQRQRDGCPGKPLPIRSHNPPW